MRRKTTEEFIDRATHTHGNVYDYTTSLYTGAQKPLDIICYTHGTFSQRPNNHINGAGCPSCGGTKRINTDEFIDAAIEVHDDLYDYNETVYVSAHKKLKIICKTHGAFYQNYVSHVHNMSGCPKCAHNDKSDTLTFITEARYTHGNTYDYNKVMYEHSKSLVEISCKKHGMFMQTPNNHLRGQGCPKCRRSHGETRIAQFLTSNNINFVEQKRFIECRRKRPLPFDFYLPDNQICIEFDGKQHQQAYKFFGGEDRFVIQQENDKIKSEFCRNNSIQLIRITGLGADLSFILTQLDF